MRPSTGFFRFPQGQKGVCGLRVGRCAFERSAATTNIRDNLIPVLAYKAVQHFVKSKKTTNVSPATWSPNLAWFGGEDVSHGHAGVAHADSRALK